MQGIMDAYRGVFRTPLTMSYPTKFTEVVSTAASYARHEQVRGMHYMQRRICVFVLLSDLTLQGGVTCRRLPMRRASCRTPYF